MPRGTAGEPTRVSAKLSTFLEQTRPGIFALWGNGGTVSHEDALHSAAIAQSEDRAAANRPTVGGCGSEAMRSRPVATARIDLFRSDEDLAEREPGVRRTRNNPYVTEISVTKSIKSVSEVTDFTNAWP